MKLVISLPTRGRPQQLLDTIRRSTANLVLPNTVLMVQVDDDDAATRNAFSSSAVAGKMDKRVTVSVRPREDTVAAKWNRALCIPADLYLVDADDAPFVTPGYDAKLLEAAAKFPDGIGMVYGHMANASFSSAVAPTARLCELMGSRIFPEYFPYWFVDHWTDDVAKLIGRISFADVRTDQAAVGKTMELREPAFWATWFDVAYKMRRREAEAIIHATHPAYREGAWKHYWINREFIEHRSRWTNHHVRAQAKQLEGWSGLTLQDPRYQRVKQKALDMVPGLLAEMSDADRAWMEPILDPPTTVASMRQAFA